MIRLFAQRDAELLFNDSRSGGFAAIERIIRRKLCSLHAAARLDDLRIPPGNRPEALRGDRAGQHSIRVNEQWRICFIWRDGEVHVMSKSSTITDPPGPRRAGAYPISPGEILLEEFMKPLGITQNRLARDIDVLVSRIAGVVKGDRAITADTALRLAQFFATSPEMWMALQSDYDLRIARLASGREIESRVRPLAA